MTVNHFINQNQQGYQTHLTLIRRYVNGHNKDWKVFSTDSQACSIGLSHLCLIDTLVSIYTFDTPLVSSQGKLGRSRPHLELRGRD